LQASEAYRAKAEQIMRDYRIEQEDILAKDPSSVQPIRVDLEVCRHTSQYRQQYGNLLFYCVQHVGAQVVFDWQRPDVDDTNRAHKIMGYMVGYESDLRYAEVLFTSARLVFSERLEPKVDPRKSDAENVYRLRSAGMERVRVSELIWGNRDKANLARVGRMYKQECSRREEQPMLAGRGVTGAVYRESYSQEFVWALARRLRRAQDGADTLRGGLVLHGREDRVREAFYTHFPRMRPSTDVEPYKADDRCTQCTDEKKCKEHRVTRKQLLEEAHSLARYHSPAAQRGRLAGTAAARTVELKRTPQAKRLGEDNLRSTLREVTGLEIEG
jgi:hypothetical protein